MHNTGRKNGEHGAVVFTVIAAIIALTTISAALARLFSTGTETNIIDNYQRQAYYTALSGLDYAKTLTATTLESIRTGTTSTSYAVDNNSFTLTVSTKNSDGTYPVSVRGKTYEGKGNYYISSVDVTPVTSGWSSTVGDYIINSANSTLTISQPTSVNSSIAGKKVIVGYGATVTGNVISSTSITLTQASTVSKNVCAANGDVTLGYGAVITGNASANGDIYMTQSSQIGGNANATEYITMEYYTKIAGKATSPYSIKYKGDGQSVGSYVQATPTINCSAPSAPYDNTITSCGTVSKNATSSGLTLSPGSYKAITTNQDGVLYLSSGTYKLCSLSSGYNAKIYLDISSGSDLTILVNGDVNFSQATTFYIKTSASSGYVQASSATPHSAAKYIYLGSSSNVTFGYSLSWFGTIYAKTSIALGQGFTLVGAIGTPGSVDIGYSMNIIEYVLADYADENWSTTAE